MALTKPCVCAVVPGALHTVRCCGCAAPSGCWRACPPCSWTLAQICTPRCRPMQSGRCTAETFAGSCACVSTGACIVRGSRPTSGTADSPMQPIHRTAKTRLGSRAWASSAHWTPACCNMRPDKPCAGRCTTLCAKPAPGRSCCPKETASQWMPGCCRAPLSRSPSCACACVTPSATPALMPGESLHPGRGASHSMLLMLRVHDWNAVDLAVIPAPLQLPLHHWKLACYCNNAHLSFSGCC